jgi:hypothetical protein
MATVGQTILYSGSYLPANATAGTFSYNWDVFFVGTSTPVGTGVATIAAPTSQNTNITWNGGAGSSYDVTLTVTQSGVACGNTQQSRRQEAVTSGVGCIPITSAVIT